MSSFLWQRIRAARKWAKLTQQQVADQLGITREAISLWENASKGIHPELSRLQAFSRITGAPLSWLVDDNADLEDAWLDRVNEPDTAHTPTSESIEDASPSTAQLSTKKIRAYNVRAVADSDDLDHDKEVMIDKVDVLLSGGPGNYIPDYVETKFQMAYRLEWFQKKGAKPERCKLFQVDGHSMEGLLWHGDLALVDLDDTRVRSGKVYALAIGNEVKVKRLFTRRDGGLRVVSDNPDKTLYPDDEVPINEMDTVAIIGRVIDKHGAGGL